ncbi:MAG: alpha/beta hydrolase [Rubrobacter sp.]|nr:alpha/beta hydrolase [Rubrobacter sp.]
MGVGGGQRTGGKAVSRRALLLLLLLAGLVLLVLFWPWVAAQARAVVVLSAVLRPPVLWPAAAALTPEPAVSDREVAGVPTLVARPEGEGPALVFVNGAVPPGRHEPNVQRLARGLARAGYEVYVPDVPGLRSGEISPSTVEATVEVARRAARGSESGRVGLVGVSVGASIALLAAEDPELNRRVSVVSGIAPYTDLKTVLRLATTGTYLRGGEPVRYRTPPYLRLVVARSLVSMLPPGEDRRALMRRLPSLESYYPPRLVDEDPLARLRAFVAARGEGLGPAAESAARLLVNQNPERFDELFADLPPRLERLVGELSPLAHADRLRAPVYIASAPRDKYFPLSESIRLAEASPRVSLTVTRALTHAIPHPSPDDLRAFARLDAFVVRSLRASAEGAQQGGQQDAGPEQGARGDEQVLHLQQRPGRSLVLGRQAQHLLRDPVDEPAGRAQLLDAGGRRPLGVA